MKSRQPTRSHEDWTWVAALVGSRARTVESQRLSGGIVSSVHGLSILDGHGLRHRLVVRRYMGADQLPEGAAVPSAGTLEQVSIHTGHVHRMTESNGTKFDALWSI